MTHGPGFAVAVGAVLLAGATVLTGCSSPDGRPAPTATVQPVIVASTTPPPSAPASASPLPRASSSTAPPVDPDAPGGQCADDALNVSVQSWPQGAGAGQRVSFVVFENTGQSPCELEGTPGLSLVGGGDGTQIGRPATRSTTGAKPVTIAPADYALATVQYTYVDKNGGVFGDGNGQDPTCKAEPADGYRVYPPHSFRAFFSPSKTYACSTDVHWISVGPVTAASSFGYFTPAL